MGPIDSLSGYYGNLLRGEMEGEDHATASVRFRGGGLGQLFVSYGRKLPGYEKDWPGGYTMRIEFVGELGTVVYEVSPNPGMHLYSESPDAPAPGTDGWYHAGGDEPFVASFYKQAEHFVDCLFRGSKPEVSAEDGVETLAALRMLYPSEEP